MHENGFGSIESSDWLSLSCAVLFSFQIIAVDHFSRRTVRLSLAEFLVVSVESTAAALLFETPSAAQFAENALPILYCGIMSSGVAYTLQILGQRDLNPAIASLIPACLESVFSAPGGSDAAAPEPFCPGSLWSCADLCCRGAGSASAGNAAPGKKDYLTSWRAESRRHSRARQAASSRADPQTGQEPEHSCAEDGTVAVSIPLRSRGAEAADRFVAARADWGSRPGTCHAARSEGKRGLCRT